MWCIVFFFQAEDGIRDLVRSRGLGDVYKRQAQKIAMHHAVMGTLAVSAGSSKLAYAWRGVLMGWSRSRWETIWAGLILLIGLQLLVYSE